MADARSILVVSHRENNCGIYQFGLQIGVALRAAKRHRFRYVECIDDTEYRAAVAEASPEVIIHNHSPTTMPWLRRGLMSRSRILQLGVVHEVTQEVADALDDRLFQFHIAPDPTLVLRNPLVFKTGRLVPEFKRDVPAPKVPTIGSFGFGTQGKGFERLIGMVQSELDEAVIRLHIPFSAYSDSSGEHARAIAARCQALIAKPGISLVLSHDFLTTEQLLEFLAGNSLNAFLYEQQKGRGISSVIDHALAVRRPIAISRSSMFRHLHDVVPAITVEDSSLREILAHGFAPLAPYADAWTPEHLVEDYERIVDSALAARDASRPASLAGRVGRGILEEAEALGYEARHHLARSAVGGRLRELRQRILSTKFGGRSV